MINSIPRSAIERLTSKFQEGKVVIVYGPRRTGKTTLINQLLENHPGKIYAGVGDDIALREILSTEDKSTISSFLGGYDVVFVDEAQRIPNVGWGLKILIDSHPKLKVIVTGSSSFQLSGQLSEPLTGRSWTTQLFPIAMREIALWKGNMEIKQKLEEYLIFGTYPEVITTLGFAEKMEYLTELKNSYLYKDILELENIQNAAKLNDLLKLLAFQLGQQVSLNELSNTLGIAKQTVDRYLDLLEKTFIIKKVTGFSQNLRKELTKTARYYFLDNGIRNSIINNFNLPNTRNDMGQLWENFCFAERLKKQEYTPIYSTNYFWRTYDQQEIDLIEQRDGGLFAYEFKWNTRKKAKAPTAWTKAYPEASFEVIDPSNFLDFVM